MAKKRTAAGGVDPPLNPARLKVAELVSVLTAAGAKGDVAAAIAADLAAGAPRNTDGTLHLIHYAAWLCTQAS